MEKCSLTMLGMTPMIMSNARAANPLDSYAKKLKTITSKRKKTDEDQEEILLIQWESRLYLNDNKEVYLPWENLFACILKAAKKHKLGPKMGALSFEKFGFPLNTKNAKNFVALRADPNNKFVKLCTIQRSKTVLCRPIFNEWSCDFDFEFDVDILDPSDMKTILITAAEEVGFGDWRQSSPSPGPYGRFVIENLKIGEK